MSWLVSVDISGRDRAAADALIADRPVYRGSHRGVAANEVGCLGEAVTLRLLSEHGVPVSAVFETTHDFELWDGRAVEVKTKDRTVAPQQYFDCSVPAYVADHQMSRVAFFVFVSLEREKQGRLAGLERFHTAHFVGVATPALMVARGRIIEAGATDVNGTTFWTDCLNVACSDLVPMSAMLHLWKKNSA